MTNQHPPTPSTSASASPLAPYYITTPIYYVNDRPHIGHCYTTLLADVAARFQRLIKGELELGTGHSALGTRHDSVFFLTGTDEHADKVVTSAMQHGVTPMAWADQNAEEFKKAFEFMNVSNDDFIRTTQPRHKEKVTRYIAALLKSGDICRGEYTGWYDEGQEEYVTETAAREHDFKSEVNKKPLVKRTEPCYFFRLGKYQQRLQELIETDVFRVAPESRKNEVLGRLRPPAVLNDVPISRPVTSDPATQWGIRVPGDGANRVYVWIDALFNYLTVVDTPELRKFWPASVHLLGKDILWFHAVIWPALLIALKNSGDEYKWVELPRCVFGHGWWVSEGQKMSKTLGNFIDLEKMKAYAGKYSLDALRWYLTTQGPLSGSDSDFAHAKFVEVYNSDLANGFGNCVSRVSNMIGKYFEGILPQTSTININVTTMDVFPSKFNSDRMYRMLTMLLHTFEWQEAFGYARFFVSSVDQYINATEPFKLAKRLSEDPANKERLGKILYECVEFLRIGSCYLYPVMPQKITEFWRRWNCAPPAGVPLAALAEFGGAYSLKPGTKIEIGDALFMRADPAEAPPV